jgi:hypothetical protein
MKGIFHWLGMNLRRRSVSETREALDDTQTDESANGSFHVVTDDLMPDIYGQATGDTVPMLEIIRDQSEDTDISEGINPYDTASLEVSKK